MSCNIIQLNEDLIKNNLKDLVRDSVEETLNALLDHEADELVCAGKYERTVALTVKSNCACPSSRASSSRRPPSNATNAVKDRSRKPLIPALHGPFLPERLHCDAKD